MKAWCCSTVGRILKTIFHTCLCCRELKTDRQPHVDEHVQLLAVIRPEAAQKRSNALQDTRTEVTVPVNDSTETSSAHLHNHHIHQVIRRSLSWTGQLLNCKSKQDKSKTNHLQELLLLLMLEEEMDRRTQQTLSTVFTVYLWKNNSSQLELQGEPAQSPPARLNWKRTSSLERDGLTRPYISLK